MIRKICLASFVTAMLFNFTALAKEEQTKELTKLDCGVIKEVGGRVACQISNTNLKIIIPEEAFKVLPEGNSTNSGGSKQ